VGKPLKIGEGIRMTRSGTTEVAKVGQAHTTLEIKVNFLRGVTRETGPMRAVGRAIHFGRRTAMAEGSLSDVSGKLFAQASTTCLILDVPCSVSPRAEVDHAYEIDDE
jgi:acyl-coenzyme A thioesterase PaaI-like protein